MHRSVVLPALAEATASPRVNLPTVPSWVVPRLGLADRLDVGTSGLLTVVSGPTGAGKTMGVGSWATGADVSGGVIWLNVARLASDPRSVWRDLRSGWLEAGVRRLPKIPSPGGPDTTRGDMLAGFGEALRSGGPWVVVLDDFPTGPSGQLGTELQMVLDQARRAVHLVLICQGKPAFDTHRHAVSGELTHVGTADLTMDSLEVAEVLRRHHVAADDATLRIVEHHTAGWACGVRQAALSLRSAESVTTAMEETDRAVADYVQREVLDKLPSPVRELLVQTSVVEDVTPGLATAVMGSDASGACDFSTVPSAFIDIRPDGSFRCHALLRSTALAGLCRENPAVARAARRRAARFNLDLGESSAALRLAVTAQDWSLVGRVLVESHSVPRLIAGVAGDPVESAARVAEVGAAEPLVLAAVALARRNVDAAEAALDHAAMRVSERPDNRRPDRLGLAFCQLAVARLRGDAAKGLPVAAQAREMLAQLCAAQQDASPELWVMLDAHVGAFEVCIGDLDRAAATLARGAGAASGSAACRLARGDCAGQLALLEAVRGNLRRSSRHASFVSAIAADPTQPGVIQAQLAGAWLHLERDELTQARQALESAANEGHGNREPWLVACEQLAGARLMTASGEPEAAWRLLAVAANTADSWGQPGWLADQLVIASAEALLAAGEPRRALGMLTPALEYASVATGVLSASARYDIGDLRGAKAALGAAASDLSGASLGLQVESWLIEARLARDEGDNARAHVLVDRALRAAGAEGLRRPFTHGARWLTGFFDRDAQLRRTHRAFIASLSLTESPSGCARVSHAGAGALLVETLSDREMQVLDLLAQMYSNDDIAQELYVSVNTVKTHMKGVFRKLCVNRRVEAVRRGRELGLC